MRRDGCGIKKTLHIRLDFPSLAPEIKVELMSSLPFSSEDVFQGGGSMDVIDLVLACESIKVRFPTPIQCETSDADMSVSSCLKHIFSR